MKEVLTVSINDGCNLMCPHCYLFKGSWGKQTMTDEIIATINLSGYKFVHVVATEPFLNSESIRATTKLGHRTKKAGLGFSVITNGLNIPLAFKLEPSLRELLDFIDVSMDGPTPQLYKKFRGGSYKKFISGVDYAKNAGIDVSILSVLSEETLGYFDEIIRVSEELSTSRFLMAPLVITASREVTFGVHREKYLADIIKMAANSLEFCQSKKGLLDIGLTHTKQSGESMDELKGLASKLGVSEKMFFLEKDPDLLIDRVLVDGKVVAPSTTLV